MQLLGVDANPDANPDVTAVPDVMAYSRAHAMVNQWDFLTGTRAQLEATWKVHPDRAGCREPRPGAYAPIGQRPARAGGRPS